MQIPVVSGVRCNCVLLYTALLLETRQVHALGSSRFLVYKMPLHTALPYLRDESSGRLGLDSTGRYSSVREPEQPANCEQGPRPSFLPCRCCFLTSTQKCPPNNPLRGAHSLPPFLDLIAVSPPNLSEPTPSFAPYFLLHAGDLTSYLNATGVKREPYLLAKRLFPSGKGGKSRWGVSRD